MPSKAFSQAKLLGTDNTISVTSLSADIPITEKLATVDDLPSTGVIGEQAFIEETNRLYIWNGSGWYNIALINETPTWDSGGQPAGSYVLDADSPQTSTTITLAASDPEGIPINYTYVTSGQMDSIATISQDSSVFTITPKTVAQAPDGGTGNITFRASDGVNILPQVSSFTLNFITVIENSRYTTLLVTATGTSDNNNITDASSNNYTITVNGDTHAGTFSPYRSGGYSTYFDNTDRVYLTNDMSVALGTSEFSMEAWIYRTTTDADENVIVNGPGNDNGWGLAISGGKIRARFHNTNLILGATTVSPNEWHHVMIARTSSNELLIFLDGTLDARSTSSSINYNATSTTLTIGSYSDRTAAVSYGFNGYIRDARVIVGYNTFPYGSYGTSVGINYFTPPSEPLTAVSGTEALLCGLPYHGDLSSNSHSVSETGGAVTKPFSPYDYDEYSTTDHGGSVYFDGTTDYLLINSPPTLGANDWTFETWYYASNPLTYNILLSQGPGNNTVVSNFSVSSSGEITIQTYTTSNVVLYATAAGIIKGDTWNHIALTHDYDGSNGGTYKIYVNGNQVGSNVSYTSGYYWNSGGIAGTALAMAQYRYNTQANGECYFSDWKISNSVTYSSNFTPPTAPLSSSGSVLHIKGTDASIIDKSQGSNLKLVGNTTGSTTQTKFSNTKSMYFDGTGDYAQLPVGSLHLGSLDFTIETWIYQDTNAGSGSSSHTIYSDWINTNNDKSILLRITDSSGQKVQLLYSTDGTTNIIYTSTSSISSSTWTHVAVCKDSTSLRLYIDGVEEIWANNPSFNLNPNAGTIGPLIGGNYDEALTSYGQFFDGYIQDFRITKGLARYTANFTPPTAPLEG